MFFNCCQYCRPISTSLSPNTESDDVRLALKLFFQPWRWKKQISQNTENCSLCSRLEEEFRKYLAVKHAVAFNSGRSALMAVLDSLGLQKGDEVLLQAFTCNAVPNPMLWLGLKPLYVDCKDDFNIDPEDLKKKITLRSKAVIVQHTFGLPVDIDEILGICRQNNLILIEDCAHTLGAEYKDKKVGAFGKAAFFSFSRDKVISSVYGGMAATNDDELAKKLREYQEKIGYPSYCWIVRQLLHPILMNWLILPTYRICGKYFLILFQWFGILSKAVDWREKRGQKPCYFPKRMPDALAALALHQFKKLEGFNAHRKELAIFYYKNLKDTEFILPCISNGGSHIFLRFPVRYPRAHEVIKKCWKNNILIGDWYTTSIAPHDTKLDKMGYEIGSCPVAEKLAKETLNLPTHINISEKEAGRIVAFLKSFLKT
ncbi:MAG: hypothetical protein A2667_02925 [Candidatus Wildermuthbacteria bacterium RIFCSPHIGHO2_01_FULL_47_27]|uniref:DegT/DnrJ/EryC1/StrS aminotransferase n=1 Tax=Candidatus Wildermuthbacteria bacterium RIFCSPHIGHO2_02_FULL_47_17 TaxID=1802452 RepID=A0A1G2R2D7_9BACT|nr:MAG: hypothetical protein A2667_02925 [Candidatus Wildermuthbacteria bacterium RIFCSPHIGHO2_01_FULL_47_27]OHA66953.1 MAG: hypothetical protein A3D59_01870 [Candidatus Wildermuthbacteria bacterium RIFCSPHIGHO2_02_FULL_47_17]OHA76545.1 MAG: hypothetical protein A3I38_03690 [Candidatus Wildermuthbacteria bacterium RIFCSPLOWO2_02_FULL_47_10]